MARFVYEVNTHKNPLTLVEKISKSFTDNKLGPGVFTKSQNSLIFHEEDLGDDDEQDDDADGSETEEETGMMSAAAQASGNQKC